MLRVEGLRAGYGSLEVLHGINLVVPRGATVALLGANGAGKSTTLRAIAGEIRPRAGKIWIDGVNTRGAPPHALAEAGVFLISDRDVFAGLTVADNFRMWTHTLPGLSSGDVEDRAVHAFPRLGDKMRQRAGTLSGGEQQMLALSRALVGEPRLLLLDEISMGLAPVVVDRLYEALSEVNTTLLIVEQFVTRALAVADYVYVMSRGRIVFVGEPPEISGQGMAAAYLEGLSA